MKLTKESKDVDLIIKSEPWSEQELADFRALIEVIKSKNKRKKTSAVTKKLKSSEAGKTL